MSHHPLFTSEQLLCSAIEWLNMGENSGERASLLMRSLALAASGSRQRECALLAASYCTLLRMGECDPLPSVSWQRVKDYLEGERIFPQQLEGAPTNMIQC